MAARELLVSQKIPSNKGMKKVRRRGILNWSIGKGKIAEMSSDENIYDQRGLGDESFLQGDVLKPNFEVQKGRLAWRARDERL